MTTRRGRRPAGGGGPLTFEVIAETLRERGRSGGLKPGDALPTQSAVMREFGASSQTVQKAMAQLKQEGLALSRPGKGAFVAHPDADADAGPDAETPPGGGTAARIQELDVALAQALEQLADLRARVQALEAGGGER